MKIALVTVARSDWNGYWPIVRELVGRGHSPSVYRTGRHPVPREEIGPYRVVNVAAGYNPGDGGRDVALSMGTITTAFADRLAGDKPDVLLVLGDRAEMFAAASAAIPLRIPIAHIHGGEHTDGAIDDVFRFCLSQMATYHFVSTWGAETSLCSNSLANWDEIYITGSPLVDAAKSFSFGGKPRAECPYVIATWHPVTRHPEETVVPMLDALNDLDAMVTLTTPNADARSNPIMETIRAFADAHYDTVVVAEDLGKEYYVLLNQADLMIGNSSSGLIEAPTFELPVVNIGMRQHGRERGANVIDCACDEGEIRAAIQKALDPAFRAGFKGMANPYGDGQAAKRIVDVLLG